MINFYTFRNRIASFSIFLLFLPAIANALTIDEEKVPEHYQIEFIIFEHLDGDKSSLDYESHTPIRFNSKQHTHIVEGFTPLTDSQKVLLPESDMRLKSSLERLKNNISVRVLTHKAWSQAIENDAVLAPLSIDVSLDENGNRRLLGEVTIKRSRYMHADFKLGVNSYINLPYQNINDWFFDTSPFPVSWILQELQIQDTFLDSKESQNIIVSAINMKQARRIKDKEVHYIDHPLLGVIVTIEKLPEIDELEIGY